MLIPIYLLFIASNSFQAVLGLCRNVFVIMNLNHKTEQSMLVFSETEEAM